MSAKDNWWARQFVETIKEITWAYDRFCITREIEDYDNAYILYEELNEAYGLSLDLLEYAEFGRAWLAKQTLPHNLE